MPDLRVPPSRARVALAHRAGLRPSSPWLVPSALCLALAAALPDAPGGAAPGRLTAALAGADVHGLGAMVFEAWSIVLAAAAGLAVAAVAATGGLGWTRRARLGRVGAVAGPSGWLALAVLVLLALALRGAVAGAARSVDAEAAGLAALWLAWLRRGLVAVGCVGAIAAALDLARAGAAIRRALFQTPDEARERGR